MLFGGNNKYPICFKFIGIGDAGVRVMSRMIQADIKEIDLIAIHTDEQTLATSGASIRIQISVPTANGQEMGSNTLEGSRDAVTKALAGADMVVIVADMGNRIGTGAAPVVADIARELGILTIGVVTKPFEVENHSRMLQAEMGIAALLALADSLVVIPNERLKYASRQQITPLNAFEIAGDALYQVVRAIINFPKPMGPICPDFCDEAMIMRNAGMVYVGVGRDAGEHSEEAAEKAAKMAISNPLMETSIYGAKRLLIDITVPERFGTEEMKSAANMVQQVIRPDDDAYLEMDFTCAETQKDEICITVFASEREMKTADDLPNER